MRTLACSNHAITHVPASTQEEQLGANNFSHIRSLDISGLRIRDTGTCFSGSAFATLRELNLDYNNLGSVSQLSGLTGLLVLKLNGNRLGEAEAGAAAFASFAPEQQQQQQQQQQQRLVPLFPSLEVLQLAGNGLANMAALMLAALPNLRELGLGGNELSRLDGLEGLTALQELVLDQNKLR